jgi:TetR/AcrR family transcriptional regulator
MVNRKPNFPAKDGHVPGTRARLLAAGIRLFSQRGFDGVSVDEIVLEAGANKRMVYHYFGSKEAIYREVLREVFERLTNIELAMVDREEGVEEALESLVRAYFAFLAANPEFVQLLLWENLGKGRHLMAAGDALSKAPILDVLHRVLRRGVREGQIGPGFDCKHLLINLIGLCLIYFSNRYTLSQSVGLDLRSPQVLQEGVNQVLRLVKHGIIDTAAAPAEALQKQRSKGKPTLKVRARAPRVQAGS